MARAFTTFISFLVCIFLAQTAFGQKTVFALVEKSPGFICLQEWDSLTLETLKEWPLNPKVVPSIDTEFSVDRSLNKAVIACRPFGENIMILDLKNRSEKVVARPSKWGALSYRFEKGSLEALVPVPILKEKDGHWQVWRLDGDAWTERRDLRTSSIKAVVSGFRWQVLATEALERIVPLDRLPFIGVSGMGGGSLLIDRVFGNSSGLGSIDIQQNRAIVLLHAFSEDNELAIFDMAKPGLRFIKCPSEFRFSEMALCGDRIVFSTGFTWAASSDMKGNVLKKRRVKASLAAMIG